MAIAKRVFLIVLDSFGIGAMPDADRFGDAGSNTLRSCFRTRRLSVPEMGRLGLFNIDGVEAGSPVAAPTGAFGRLAESSQGKDTTIGHWEIAGLVSPVPLPTYPNGFPAEIIGAFERATGYKALCNAPFSGTEVLRQFGAEQMQGKNVIVYTSADSVFQVAAHTDVVPLEELYRICRVARELLVGPHSVGRVIARPFAGQAPDFYRTSDRHDFSLSPPGATVLDAVSGAGMQTIAVGKISDIFAGKGIGETHPTKSNDEGMACTSRLLETDFTGLCFVNLVDFDMLYGHRNDAGGYADALNRFDVWLGRALPALREDDILMITADHGCDPGAPGTDHSREYVPLLICGRPVQPGRNLGTRQGFAHIGKTILDFLGVEGGIAGSTLVDLVL